MEKQLRTELESFEDLIFDGKAININDFYALKKKLLKDNFQKELAKREYYEKPSAKRKRVKATGVKKGQKLLREKIMRGEAMPPATVGQKHLKGKRSLNKYRATKRLMQQRDWARK